MATNNAIGASLPISVSNGGMGAGSHTAYGVLCGGTTSTGAVQSIAGVGTSGQVLTSNGAAALPTFQSFGSLVILHTTITLTSAQIKAITTTPITIVAAQGAGTVVVPLLATTKFVYGGTNAFTGGGSNNAVVLTFVGATPSSSVGNAVVSDATITGTTTTYSFSAFNQSTRSSITAASCENSALIAFSPGIALTGNAANNNTLTIDLFYQVLSI